MRNCADTAGPGISRWWGDEIYFFFANSSTDDEQHQRRYGPSAEEQLDGPSTELWSIKYLERWAMPIGMLPGKSLGLETVLVLRPVDGVPAHSHDARQPTTDDRQIPPLNSARHRHEKKFHSNFLVLYR